MTVCSSCDACSASTAQCMLQSTAAAAARKATKELVLHRSHSFQWLQAQQGLHTGQQPMNVTRLRPSPIQEAPGRQLQDQGSTGAGLDLSRVIAQLERLCQDCGADPQELLAKPNILEVLFGRPALPSICCKHWLLRSARMAAAHKGCGLT